MWTLFLMRCDRAHAGRQGPVRPGRAARRARTPGAAADLIAAAGAGQAGLADLRMGADEVLDATARRQIRARLASLGEDIAEAES